MSAGIKVESPFGPSREEARRLVRTIQWSIGVHVAVVLVLWVAPRAWWQRPAENKPVMTISLGGTPGPRSTGTASIGGRTVEQVAPPPRRPEPIRPTPERPPTPTVVKPSPKPVAPAPRPVETPVPPQPEAARPPVTGREIVAGNTAVETGARGQGAGLTFGGGGTGGETDLSNFCCPEYLQLMVSAIDSRWNRNQTERGTTVLKFTVARSGRIEAVSTESSSGHGILDRASRAALADARLPALPGAYPNPTLTVHLTFSYGAQ